MRKMTPDELKGKCVEVLEYIDDICNKNDITYYILFGTLIGAVRHKGFIPWDDDIDIGMPRSEYDRFIDVMKRQEKLKMICFETDPDYYFTFARVCDRSTSLIIRGLQEIHEYGVHVDVFPMDNAPSQADMAQFYKTFVKLRKKVKYTVPASARYNDHAIKTVLRRIKRFPQRMIWNPDNFERYRMDLVRHITQYNNKPSDRYMIPETAYHERCVFDKSMFEERIQLDFEGLKVYAPAGYDRFLRELFGDYMQLPPERERKSKHIFTAYWKDDVPV